MGATWSCSYCNADVLGSTCDCRDEKDERIEQLEHCLRGCLKAQELGFWKLDGVCDPDVRGVLEDK